MEKEKIKEIIEKIKSHYVIIDTEGTGDIGAEHTLQEYGQWVRQQTLEEAIAIVKSNSKGSFTDNTGNECWYIDELISNLQALKDKNK